VSTRVETLDIKVAFAEQMIQLALDAVGEASTNARHLPMCQVEAALDRAMTEIKSARKLILDAT
jgi:hypothetical protein